MSVAVNSFPQYRHGCMIRGLPPLRFFHKDWRTRAAQARLTYARRGCTLSRRVDVLYATRHERSRVDRTRDQARAVWAAKLRGGRRVSSMAARPRSRPPPIRAAVSHRPPHPAATRKIPCGFARVRKRTHASTTGVPYSTNGPAVLRTTLVRRTKTSTDCASLLSATRITIVQGPRCAIRVG